MAEATGALPGVSSSAEHVTPGGYTLTVSH
jgi:hypothetical protein